MEANPRRDFLNRFELRHHRRRHFLARLLVAGLEFRPALRQAAIPDDRAEVGLKMFQHEPERFGESENCVGRFAAGIREMQNREIRAVNVVVTIDQQEFQKMEQDLLDCQDERSGTCNRLPILVIL